MAEGLYAYALTREAVARELHVSGVGGVDVTAVTDEGLAAIVSTVDLEDFGEDGLRRHLEDIDWVRDIAFAHDDVVREVARLGPVAPLRLATVFVGPDSVRDRVRELGTQVAEVLDRVEGRGEWSVKAYSERPEDSGSGQQGQDERPASGRDYLARRRQQAQDRETASEQHVAAVEGLHQDLAQVAVAGRHLPAQDRQLTGHRGEMLMNGAYLVHEADAERFRRIVEERETPTGLRLAVEGPWPPYSFAVLESS